MTITRRTTLGLLAAAAVLPEVAAAQAFPTRPIKIVVPYPAGGPTDALARIVAQELGSALGGSAIVENAGGGAGAIGTRQVAKADPDGHTLVLSTNQTHATNYVLLKDPGYEAKDFAAVAGLADLQHVLDASGVGAEVDLSGWADDVLAAAAADLGVTSDAWQRTGGEEHALVVVAPPAATGVPGRAIGRIVDGSDIVWADGAALRSGFDHFGGST